jgi:hypothetical protein
MGGVVVFAFFLLVVLLVIGVVSGGVAPGKKAQPAKRQQPVPDLQSAKVAAVDIELLYKQHLQNDDDERFEAWVRKHFGETIDKQLLTRVAGVTFANSDGTVRQELISQCRKYQLLRLVADPENPHDKGAIRVETLSGSALGYVPHNFNLPFGPDRWHAVVRAVNPADGKMPASLIICLLRKAENNELSESDRWIMERFGPQVDRYYVWEIERYQGLNPDGSDRQALVAECHRDDPLILDPETNNGRCFGLMRVCNSQSQILGYLDIQRSRWLASEMSSGRKWKAVAFQQLSTPGGKRRFLEIICFRLR